MKKLLTFLFVTIFALAGCGSSTAGADLSGKTITIATSSINEDDPTSDEAIADANTAREKKATMLDEFQKETGVALEFVELPQEEQLETITQSVVAGDPVADVVRVSGDTYQQLVASDTLSDISEFSKEEMKNGDLPTTWSFDAGQVFDKYYGVSRDLAPNPEMLVYDKSLLTQAGVEKTPLQMYTDGEWNWENARQYFLDIQTAIGDDYTVWSAEPYFVAKYGIASNGVVPITPDGQVNLTDDKVYEALDFYKGLYDDGIMKFYLDEEGAPIWAEAEADWEGGKSVFTTLEGWRSDVAIRNTDKEYGFVPYPTNDGVDEAAMQVPAGTGDMYIVPKGVEDVGAAAQVAFYLNRQANVNYYVDGIDVTADSADWMNRNSSEENNGDAYAAVRANAVPDLSGLYQANTDFDLTESVTNYFVSGESISSAFESGSKVIEQNIETLKGSMSDTE